MAAGYYAENNNGTRYTIMVSPIELIEAIIITIREMTIEMCNKDILILSISSRKPLTRTVM